MRIGNLVYIRRSVVPGSAGGGMAPQILTNQLTLSEPGGTNYAHHINTWTPGFSDLPTALIHTQYYNFIVCITKGQ